MVAVITGGADGIGRQCAALLVKKGYKVYDISRRTGSSRYVHHVEADVADRKGLEAALGSIYKTEGKVDILITSAGVSLASPAELTRTADMRRLYDINFWGTVYAVNFVMRRMKKEGAGSIVLLSSLTGVLPIPYLSYYSSSKAALANWAAAVANEAKPFGVRVSAVAPGGVRTQFSYKRKKYKNCEDDSRAPGLAKAIHAITTIEQKGQSPERVAACVVQTAESPCPPALQPTGPLYHVGLKLLGLAPNRLVQSALYKLFAEEDASPPA